MKRLSVLLAAALLSSACAGVPRIDAPAVAGAGTLPSLVFVHHPA